MTLKRLFLVHFKRISIFLGFLLSASMPIHATVTGFTSQNVNSITYEASTTNDIVMHWTVNDSGTGDTLQGVTIANPTNFGYPYDAKQPNDLLSVKLWWDADGNTTSGMALVGTFTVDPVVNTRWALPSLSQPVANGDHFFITVDVQSPTLLTGTRAMRFQVPANGMAFSGAGTAQPSANLGNASTLFLTPQTPATHFQVSLTNTMSTTIGVGQANVPLAQFDLVSDPTSGHENDAGIFLTGFYLYFYDGSTPVSPASVISDLSAYSPVESSYYLDPTIADSSYIAANETGNRLFVDLTQFVGEGLSFDPYFPNSVQVLASILPSASLSSFHVEAQAAGQFLGTDSYSGAPVTAVAFPSFPLISSSAIFQQAATVIHASMSASGAATQVAKGSQNNIAFKTVLSNPGAANTGVAQVNSIYFTLWDENGSPVVPNTALTRIRVDDGVNTYLYRTVTEGSGNKVVCQFTIPVNVSVQNPVTLTLKYDVQTGAIPMKLRFRVDSIGLAALPDWKVIQAGVTPAVDVDTTGNAPFVPPLVPIVTNLLVSHIPNGPAVLFLGQAGVTFMDLVLTHPGPAPVGPLVVQSIAFHLKGASNQPLDAAQSLSALQLVGGPSQTITFSSDQAILTFTGGVTLNASAPGNSVTYTLTGTVSNAFTGSSLKFVLPDGSSFTATQPSDPGRTVWAQAAPGDVFPMESTAIPVEGGTLGDSFSNFPNPFRAGSENTRLAYKLDQAGTVTLRIMTLTGKPVRKIVSNETRNAGLNMDSWDGRNNSGQTVLNGVYIAVLEASGKTVTRYVAVAK